MLSLYRAALIFYEFLAWVLSHFNTKAKAWVTGQRDIYESINGTNPDQRKVLWIHAASVGEFEQGRPIIEAVRAQKLDYFILLTFFSPSGYQLRKNYELADQVSYLPLDSPANARKFLDAIRPSLAIFIKYEFWYFYLKGLQEREVPILYVSCILRKDHYLLRSYGRFFHKVLKGIDHYFVQDEQTGNLLKSIGIDRFTVAGDTRFDRVLEIANKAGDVPLVGPFINEEPVLVIGSAWPSDLDVIRPLILELKDELKIIIAPHNIEEHQLEPFLRLPDTIRYSKLDKDNASGSRILIIDNIGMLSRLYKYAKYAMVGGAFNGTLHNVLEPAVYGIPVFFGKHKNNEKFLEARGLIKAGGGFAFADVKELRRLLGPMREDDKKYQKAARAAGDFVKSGSGATERIMKEIQKLG